MTKLEQAARQALDALEKYADWRCTPETDQTIRALREALAEPQVDWYEEAMRLAGLNAKNVGELRKLEAEQVEQEPVSMFEWQNGNPVGLRKAAPVRTKDLTVDEKVALADRLNLNGRIVVIDAVIAAYKEKNK